MTQPIRVMEHLNSRPILVIVLLYNVLGGTLAFLLFLVQAVLVVIREVIVAVMEWWNIRPGRTLEAIDGGEMTEVVTMRAWMRHLWRLLGMLALGVMEPFRQTDRDD